MDKKFTSGDTPLGDLLRQAGHGTLQLPDFQRNWVWDDGHISSLLASISLSYPIGAVMTLRTGNPEVKFKPRALEGAKAAATVEPELLLLDGQQRITSLYLALGSGEPVPTRDARGNPIHRRYFADIARCIDPDQDREEAILSVSADGLLRSRGEVGVDVSSLQGQVDAGLFPLEIVLDAAKTRKWMRQFCASDGADADRRIEQWDAFEEAVVHNFERYTVPSIELAKMTPKEAVCQVFEKVNTGGVSLTVFELLTATFAADDFALRDDWAEREKLMAEHHVLGAFRSTDFLQIISLLATYHRRAQHLETHPGDDRAPATSCKRRDVLRLTVNDYQSWADTVTDALPKVVRFVHAERVFKESDLPYPTQLVPLTAIFVVLGDQAESHGVAEMLRRWYWCGVFGEMYGTSTETRFANDLQDVVGWVKSGMDEPRTIRESQLQAGRLVRLQTRNSAAYKGLYALQMKRGGRDFRTGNTIDLHAYLDDAIDIHHIFPQDWCRANGVQRWIMNSIVNKTAIDSRTNRRIGGNAPSVYVERLQKNEKISPEELDAILSSHDIDPIALRADDFEEFFTKRLERLIKQVESATGKAVTRSQDGSDSPFARTDSSGDAEGIIAVAKAGESRIVEFKSTALKNLRTGERDSQMEWAIVKTLAGFMNGNGGSLLVGVADDGSFLGIEQDFPMLGKKQDSDGWELWLTDRISSSLGKVAAADLRTTICKVEDHTIARIDVGPAAAPVFASTIKGEKRQAFFVRVNNSTQELSGQEAHDYQRRRWPS
ncbi:GmrSD restriction endonuclease domain-containing protein [Mycolicibacterium fortuitum]|uniref:GmrSD restriction endonuclease domain-containing protein n=1 Tax=Mycolicibacterium fortuitum TaxID=1766 RepID=UPI001CE177E5|nr:DUF262 domain-containing protein [Mycolicibacterium fortuitum]MCA4726562.1 DUF262 domain-containing protein [Mycolicibacterium fortuitum]